MSQAGFSSQISGADKFQLLLDRHIRKTQTTGNVIRLSIEVKEKIDVHKLKEAVENNSFITEINSLEIEGGFFSVPKWKQGETQKVVTVSEHITEDDSFIPAQVLVRDIAVNSGNLLHIDLVQGKNNSTLIISAHHVLADNRGIQSIANIIEGTIKAEGSPFAKEEKDTTSVFQQLVHTLKATLLVFKKTPKKMAKVTSSALRAPSPSGEGIAGLSIIRFTQEETNTIEENAVKNGARLSKSSFYLAATAMALRQTIFANKGDSFFLPVPQNQRLRGNEQVALGNQLSFLFYAIPFKKLNNLIEATACINEQLMEQAKQQLPKSYSYLLKSFRFLPLTVYDLFFKMPTNGAVCSFLFSDAGETLPGVGTYFGKEIIEVLNFPPNPSPPGITFVFMKHAGALKIITAYDRKVISTDEIDKFETEIKSSLRA